MIGITAITHTGESFVLSPNEAYAIKKVSGLSPQSGTIVNKKMAGHGTTHINATTDERNIVIDLKILGDVEANRDALYAAFPPGMPVTLELDTGAKQVSIDGYVELCDVDFFQAVTIGQISIICPKPFFKAEEIVGEVPGAASPCIVTSSCPHPRGFTITIHLDEDVDGFTMYKDGEECIIINASIFAGNVWTIDTEAHTVLHNGANAFHCMQGTWLQLTKGENCFTATSPCTITYDDWLMGI